MNSELTILYEYPFKQERMLLDEMADKFLYRYDKRRGGYFIIGVNEEVFDTRFVIPDKVADEPVIGIAAYAFKHSDVMSLMLPFTCRYIDEYAFEGCYQLQHIGLYFDPLEIKIHPKAFANSLFRGVQDFSFYNLEKMKEDKAEIEEFEILSGGNGKTIVAYHGKAKYIRLPEEYNGEAIREIYDKAFYYSNIKGVEIPENYQQIGNRAFGNCFLLETAKLPTSGCKLGSAVFSGDACLREVNLPAGIKEIPCALFCDCHELKEIKLPNTVQKIGSVAFCCCFEMKKIICPDAVKKIDYRAFYLASGLEEIVLSKNCEIDDFAFQSCEKIKIKYKEEEVW